MPDHESHNSNSQLLTEQQAAASLRHSVSTLRRWRRAGTGPTFVRFGRVILYRVEDIEEFVMTHLSKREVA